MVQGTSSSVGKSLLVTGLCRLFADVGIRVAPFKAQNMSNNAAVTDTGGEIGRAQWVQARAARVRPRVEMNPVLLKPESNHRSQVILLGHPLATLDYRDYRKRREETWPAITAALDTLRAEHDLVIIEGAGSPAETNLRDRDVVNMAIALYANASVLLAGDIDRGGVFAHLYGTWALVAPEERALIRGFILNKFRGDATLLTPAIEDLQRLTGIPTIGIVPWFPRHEIPEEDAVALEARSSDSAGSWPGIDVAVMRFPRIANFDDLDPLSAEPDVRVRWVESAAEWGDPDLVILPGTKSTIADLDWLRAQGLETHLKASAKAGTGVLGLCGGYQMLGASLADPSRVEGDREYADGLGLLPVTTVFAAGKRTVQSRATVTGDQGLLEGARGIEVTGYEIHAGQTSVVPPAVTPAVTLPDGASVGVADEGGWIAGCYLHGLLHNDEFRRVLLTNIARRRHRQYAPAPPRDDEAAFDRLAGALRASLDLRLLTELTGIAL
ncbi:MAG: cobyric acid synthase [Dehalococcoidia bacterium]|nr:MAG: cobyric acid synthase [Dehalococcoidia bacterium]